MFNNQRSTYRITLRIEKQMNDLENILKAINALIENGNFPRAKELAENITSKVDKLNTLGVIFHQEKNDDKALELLQQALLIEPGHYDALYNYAILLLEKGDPFNSWRYLTRIRNKTWDVYNTLGDTQLKQDNPIMALHYYKKASALSDLDEMKDKYDHIKNSYKKSIKLAIFCLPGLDNFVKDIVETFSLRYDVKLIVSTDGNEITKAIKWADIVWLEWANELAVFATNKVPEIENKKVICRLHRYEAFTQFPEKINWGNIDQLIFVANSMKLIFHQLHPNFDFQSWKEEIVYNGVDLDKFKFSIHKPGYNLAVLAHINYRKNPETWIQIIGKLKNLDNKYKLHVGGDFQDPLYKEYFEYIKKEMKMGDNFILHGWINNVEKFLEDKNYIISTSIHESFGYNIAEAMARAIKPIIHNFDGAKTLWPKELIYNTIDEAVEKITEQTYDSESYRMFIEDNYSLEQQIKTLETTLNTLKKIDKKITKKVAEDQNVLFLDNIISKFIEFTPYTDKYIDSFDFEDSKIRIGKVEKITDEVSLIEFIVKNKKGQQLALQNIWYNHSTKQITLPAYISLSKNKKIIQNFVLQILDSRLSYIGNMGGFINDEEILEDIKRNQLAYNWERGIPATQFMPAFGYLKTMLRYSFVSQFIKESHVILDAACGFGYGSAYFSKLCNKVYALDLAEDNIKFGENTYSFKNLNWILGDVTALPFENDKFDIYVSFETFEHLPLQPIDNYIEEAIRVVKKDGLFILSTPNRETRKNIHNPFHIKEYNFQELISIVKQYFTKTKFFSQVNFAITEGYNEHASNFIVVCTNNKFKTSDYWEKRYKSGGNSGKGSYGLLASFKAQCINDFISEKNIKSAIEFGVGDGNNLSLYNIERYLGLDVSECAIEICKNRFHNDGSKQFATIGSLDALSLKEKYDCGLSLDVLYHLVEYDVYETYLHNLFASAQKYVIIYAWEALKETVQWFKLYYSGVGQEEMYKETRDQILRYQDAVDGLHGRKL
jgi:2-polyprenyl-3-methyl-5-hydroxy-6-metoxy-1,4-benzoquinol methylase/glycosyltransferase involved in cell wall biosynthesis/ribosomal protein S20